VRFVPTETSSHDPISRSKSSVYGAPVALVWSAIAIVYVVWGSTYLAIKVSIETLPPLTSAGLRFLAASIVLGLIVLIVRRSSFRITRKEASTAALAGLLLLVGGNGLVVVAEESISSGLAALLVSTTPLWIVVLRSVVGDRPSVLTVIGVLVGFAGVAIVLLPGSDGLDGDLPHALLIVVAALSWATGSLLATRRPMPANPFVGSVVEMFAGGLALVVIGLFRGELADFDLSQLSTRSVLGWVYLVGFGSVVAFSAFVWVLDKAPVSTVATYAYVNPVIAVALGALVLSERVGVPVLLGGLVIVAAIGVVVTAEGRQRRASQSREPLEACGAAGSSPGTVEHRAELGVERRRDDDGSR
jgi:drug/metabolite transporter (DMT)-like permease